LRFCQGGSATTICEESQCSPPDRLNDQINERSHPEQLQDEPLRSLNYAAEIVDCFDEMSGTGGFHRAPPLKLKEHIQRMAVETKAVNGSGPLRSI
jgi:hypothetical protein